ncbi:MAG: hypothetical protein KGJ02_02255 [Verrucomicrobiota bacterium]|nr:hypothetical protein [Verrucomicrobiota bacterium]
MRKQTAYILASLFVSVSALSAEGESTMQEIQCEIKPISRSKIHPKGVAFATTSPTMDSVSSNWSGYVAGTSLDGSASANNTVTYAAGEWVIPTLLPTSEGTYSAIWVGIDGYMSGTVEQIGTSHNWINGAQQNYAWFEMYPNGAYEINGFPVNNGDIISARVAYKDNGVFKLVMFNHTKGVSTTIPSTYTTSSTVARSCAEWIVEAPYSGSILPLADFQTVTFNYCSAIINGVHGVINNGAWVNDQITMQGSSGVIAQPTNLLKKGDCFQVAWK